MHPRTLENQLLTADLPLSEPFDWLGQDALALDKPIVEYLRERGVSNGALGLIDVTINANDLEHASALMYLRDVQRLAWAMGAGAGGNRSLYQPGAGGRFAYIKGGQYHKFGGYYKIAPDYSKGITYSKDLPEKQREFEARKEEIIERARQSTVR